MLATFGAGDAAAQHKVCLAGDVVKGLCMCLHKELLVIGCARLCSRLSGEDRADATLALASIAYLLGVTRALAEKQALPPEQVAVLGACLQVGQGRYWCCHHPPACAGHLTALDLSQLLRDLCAREDGGAAVSGRNLASVVLEAGGVQLMLALLAALAPIQGGRGSQQAPAMSPPTATAAPIPSRLPYPGFRSDVVAGKHLDHPKALVHIFWQAFIVVCLFAVVVANIVHGRPEAQSMVQELGGVELVLSQCQVGLRHPLWWQVGAALSPVPSFVNFAQCQSSQGCTNMLWTDG